MHCENAEKDKVAYNVCYCQYTKEILFHSRFQIAKFVLASGVGYT